MTDWLYLPPWGIRLVALAGVALVTLGLARALRERRLVPVRRQWLTLALRAVVIAGLVWIALNPTALRPHEVEGKPSLVVLVDTSASMATPDVSGETRLAAALKVLGDRGSLGPLERAFTLDIRTFDKDSRPANLAALAASAAEGRASDLGAALSTAVADLADRPSQAGVLLVSDGRATTDGATEAGRLALARSVPLWTWCLGGEVKRHDLWVEAPGNEALSFAGANVDLSATLHSVGYEHRSFRVDLLQDDKVVATLEAVPGPTGEAPLKASVKAPDAGEHQFVWRVAEDKDEVDKTNNKRSVFVRVVGEKVRVLLVEGQPHWDSKFLVQCLKRNPRVELTAVYRLGTERPFAVTSSAGGSDQSREEKDLFPRTAEDFQKYDIIIMGRGCEIFFDEKTEGLLSDFVARHGGGLVFSRGKPYSGRFQALAKLDPIVWGTGAVEGVRLVPSEIGGATPVFELASAGPVESLITQLPPFDQAMQTVGVKPLATILATCQSVAGASAIEPPVAMAYHYYGQGRVVSLNAGGLWRWAFREKSSEDVQQAYERFWNGMLCWLLSGSDFLAGADVALRSDRRLYTDEQPMRLLVRTRGLDQETYRPHLSIRGKGVETDLEPRPQPGGAFGAEAGPFPPGTYQVTLRSNVGQPAEVPLTVEVESASIENRVLSADADLMRRLAEISEGRVLAAADVSRLDDVVREWKARRQLSDEKTQLWDHWVLLAALVAALGLEWFLRRREGLL